MAEKGGRSWKMVALLGLVYVLAFIVLAQEPWLVAQMAREDQMTRVAIGPDRAEAVKAQATRWFDHAFVESGVEANSFRLLVPSEEDKARDPHRDKSEKFWGFISERLRVIWTLVYQALSRVALALVWVPVGLTMVVAFGVDGLVARKIKQTNFDYASPVRHRYSVIAIDIALVLFALGLFSPVAISPVVLPVFFLLLAWASGVLLANVQKQV